MSALIEKRVFCSGGWRSLNPVLVKGFLGHLWQGKTVLMRVYDWWLRIGDEVIGRCGFVNVPDKLSQKGYDLIPEFEVKT